jgi:hypothetical protein
MSDSKEIMTIIAGGTMAAIERDAVPQEVMRRLTADMQFSGGDVRYAVVVMSRDAVDDAEAMQGPIRVVASSSYDTRVEKAVRLVGELTPDVEPPGPGVVLQARRNAQLRARFIADQPTYSSEEIAELAGSRATNRAALANRWRKEGQIFAVRHRGELRYPAFQFDDDGRPRPELQDVLGVFAERHAADWEIALWFASDHPRAGRSPYEVLLDDPQTVELLARQSLDLPE